LGSAWELIGDPPGGARYQVLMIWISSRPSFGPWLGSLVSIAQERVA
jgi:hypothetical protein